MAQDPAFLVYYKDILVSCADWDADILGWYFRLLSHQADKQGGLNPNIESLALLAGVKFSQFDRFKRCWDENLSKKFELNEAGLLVNLVQAGYLSDRRDYKGKQAHRGLIGYFVKRIRKETNLTNQEIEQITPLLFQSLSTENSKSENEKCFKRTLKAYIGDVNGDHTVFNKNNKGAPTGWNQFPGQDSFGLDLPEIKIGSAQELIRIGTGKNILKPDILALWKIFKEMHFTGKKFYADEEATYSHFLNWLKTQKINGTDKQTIAGNGRKLGTSDARTEKARTWGTPDE